MLEIRDELNRYITVPTFFKTLFVIAIAIVLGYIVSEQIARLIIKVAQRIAIHSDNAPNDERQIRLRRVETYLSVTIAVVRASIVALAAYGGYKLVNPHTPNSTATIGASAFFIVLAGGTVGPLLRDITAGATMIAERWYNVGDHVRIEPFMDVGGVIERITLRSTKLRSLNGEVVWIHNQYIQGAKVTPYGLRTIAVDIFVSEAEAGAKLIEKAIFVIPTGPLMLARPLVITRNEKWSDALYHIEVIGQTPPGREWLIENFFVDSVKQLDSKRKQPLLVHAPLVRNADPEADRNFRRAVRVAKQQATAPKRPL